MIPISMVGWLECRRLGRKPLFLVAFTVLPVRAMLYTLSDNTAWLLSVQLLDGLGVGAFSCALMPLVVADITREPVATIWLWAA